MAETLAVINGRTCKTCGGSILTGFAACSTCGAVFRSAQTRPASVSISMRKRRKQPEQPGNSRYQTAMAVFALLTVLGGTGVYYGSSFMTTCIDAGGSLIPAPVTLADDLHNQQIHAARQRLFIE